jgi:hypothetical protein
MPSLPPRRRNSTHQSVCAKSCSLRSKPKSSTSGAAITRLNYVRFRYSLVTRNHPLDGFVGRLQSLGFPPPCYPSYGAPTSTPVGLTPTGCASLCWTHRLARRSLALRPAHSRCHQFVTCISRRLQPFRYLHSCSGSFRLEQSPGGPCTHWKTPPLHGAHPELPVVNGSFRQFGAHGWQEPDGDGVRMRARRTARSV